MTTMIWKREEVEVDKLGNGLTQITRQNGEQPWVPTNELTMVRRMVPPVEWVDPITAQVHTCPKKFVDGVEKFIERGAENAQTAAKLLALMGEPDTQSNARHVRHATLYLRQSGIPAISLRSSEGGYFIAANSDELAEYVVTQTKLAKSMLLEAENLQRTATFA